jgi:GNAT superfamily N-acetyltransferase
MAVGAHDARLVWQVCDECRYGRINKISVAPEHQRQGLRRRMLLRALRDGPGYDWRTTGQSDHGRAFFTAMRAETGAALTRAVRSCGATCRGVIRVAGGAPGRWTGRFELCRVARSPVAARGAPSPTRGKEGHRAGGT